MHGPRPHYPPPNPIMPDPRDTPAMQQHARFKARHPDCVLLFRVGDFYELFDDDAVVVSKAIGLTLTQRTAGIPMAGVPYHQLETYLKKLVAHGFRVAVCEQLEDASQAKGIVRRGVTRVITPGTLVDESLVESDRAGTLAAVAFTQSGDDSPASVGVVDVSTGEFCVLSIPAGTLVDELARRNVRELLYASAGETEPAPRVARVLHGLGISGTPRPSWHFRSDEAFQAVSRQFGVSTLAGFGLRDDDTCIAPAGVLVRYLQETQSLSPDDLPAGESARGSLSHLRPPRRETDQAALVIDAVSLRALEVESTMRGVGGNGAGHDASLLGIFLAPKNGKSFCRTQMGRRLLRDWLVRPLRDVAAITKRQDGVSTLVEDRTLAARVGTILDRVQDVARLGGRVALGRAGPRDLAALGRSVSEAPALAVELEGASSLGDLARVLAQAKEACRALADEINAAIVDDAPAHIRDGGAIRDGVDAELDEARTLARDATTWLAEYQARLSSEHALPGLKVGFNRVFGYYIELPAAQARQAPALLTRTQTLKNAERYTTPELRQFEAKVSTAEARGLEREKAIFDALCARVNAALPTLAIVADAIAQLDVLLAFADKAVRRRWVRPIVTDEPELRIDAGRHPVLDEMLGADFVPNDTDLGAADPEGREARSARLALITGPNMAGKSTYIRQVALIGLLAHTGSFVPADRATIGLIDRIFTRIGADDALHAGLSTFMVEMVETANILHHCTPRSLVVLDEVGRGTSTLDGLALAWAIVEHLASPGNAKKPPRDAGGPRTLFATHYHELTSLEETFPGRVRNLQVAVREWPAGDGQAQIVFLHRILPGRADQSYGLHVASLAGIPAQVVARGREVLASLAVQHGVTPPRPARPAKSDGKANPSQLGLFGSAAPHPAVDALREVILEALSPLDAFDVLRRLKSLLDDR